MDCHQRSTVSDGAEGGRSLGVLMHRIGDDIDGAIEGGQSSSVTGLHCGKRYIVARRSSGISIGVIG